MPAFSLQEALAAERRANDALAYNRRAAHRSQAAQRRAAELQLRRIAAQLAAAQRNQPADA